MAQRPCLIMNRAILPLALLLLPGVAQAARGDLREFQSHPDWSVVVDVIAPPATPWRVRPEEARAVSVRQAPAVPAPQRVAAPARSQISAR